MLLLVCALQFVVVADANAMAIALPPAGRAFGADAADLQWVLSGYTLCFGAALLVGGRIADFWGRRRMCVAGSAAFAAGGLAAVSATSLPMLVLARSAQGLAAAVAVPAALALLSSRRPHGTARSRDVSVFGAMVAIGFVGGVVGGGWLTGLAGWRAVPAMTVPVAVLVVIAGRGLRPKEAVQRRPTAPALGSALLLAGALVAFVYPLSRSADLGWRSLQLVGGLLLAAGLVTLLVLRERASPAPLVPVGSLRTAGMRAGLCGAVLTLATSAGATYALVLYLQDALAYTPMATGWALLAFGVGGVAGGALGRHPAAHRNARALLASGLIAQAAGCVLIATMPAGPTPGSLFAGMTLIGFGNVVATITFTIVGLSQTPVEDHGAASGLLATAQQVGATVGLAVAGALLAGDSVTLGGLRRALIGCAAMSALGAACVAAHVRRKPAQTARRPWLRGKRARLPKIMDHRATAHDE